MKKTTHYLRILIPIVGMAGLILDSKTAAAGAADGIQLCLGVVIPSLFPFIFASLLFTSMLTANPPTFLNWIGRGLKLPHGAEGLLLVGLLGGYPVGAQAIAQSHAAGSIDEKTAGYLLAFCNNCGPAFLFGMVGSCFQESWMPWALWGIHVLSALCVGALIKINVSTVVVKTSHHTTIVEGLYQSLRIVAGICGWVVIFRILISMTEKWLLSSLPELVQITLSGALELTNGCIRGAEINNTGIRFVLCEAFVSFGGLCVVMQTFSVASAVEKRLYLPGKLLQTGIGILLSYPIQYFVLPDDNQLVLPIWFLIAIGILCTAIVLQLRKSKNNSRILMKAGV